MSNKNNELEKQEKTRTVRCIICRTETPEDELPVNVSECPECGAKAKPTYVDHDVDIRINWHELRVLCMWARNWEVDPYMEDGSRSLVDAITKQLDIYRPIDGLPLSMQQTWTEASNQEVTH